MVMELPRGYGSAAEEPPAEKPMPLCTCGHDYEDHDAKPDAESMEQALSHTIEALKKLQAQLSRITHSDLAQAIAIAERGLSICSGDDCECSRYRESEPNEDDRY